MNNIQIQLPRLFIYQSDFRQARKFAWYILKKGLHDKKKTELAEANRELVHSAFNTSLIVSYSRPFGWNKEFPGQVKSSLREYINEVLNEDEIKLHERIITLRHSTYAHSQASSHLIEGWDYNKRPAITHYITPLEKLAISKLKIMIGKWIKFLEAEESKLKGSKRSASNSIFSPLAN